MLASESESFETCGSEDESDEDASSTTTQIITPKLKGKSYASSHKPRQPSSPAPSVSLGYSDTSRREVILAARAARKNDCANHSSSFSYPEKILNGESVVIDQHPEPRVLEAAHALLLLHFGAIDNSVPRFLLSL
jgi:hypothetical protein